MNTYYRLPAGELWVRPEGYLHLIWGPGSEDVVAAQNLFDEVLRLLQATGYRKLLTDQRQRVPITEEYREWLLLSWLPRAAAGRHVARVAVVTTAPESMRVASQGIRLEGERRYGIRTSYFPTTEQASQWLQDPEQPPAA